MRRIPILAMMMVMATAPETLAQTSHPMTIKDMGLLAGLGSPQLSPDGATIALSVSRTDYETFESESSIELVSLETGSTGKFLLEGSSPQWSPDGRHLAYLGSHDGKSGLLVVEIFAEDGTHSLAEGKFLTEIHRSDHFIGHRSRKNWAWSPDGKWIAYIGADPKPEIAEDASDVRVITRTLYKTRTGFSDNRTVHVWIVAADGQSESRCLTRGAFDEHSLAWAPDSRRIAFCSNRSAEPDHNYSEDIFTVEIESGSTSRITYSPGTETTIAYSPDGKWISYHATLRPLNTKDSPPEDTQLYIIPAGGGAAKCLSKSLDRRVGSYLWHPDSSSIYFTAGDHGKRPIFRTNIQTASVDRLVDLPSSVRSFSFDEAGEKLAITVSDPTHPTSLWLTDADLKDFYPVGKYQDEFLKAVELVDAETFWFESFDGTPVQGWVMKPVGYEAGQTYPTILSVHGGPHGMYGFSFSSRQQWLAANGYGVVFINPRGSSGYGQVFTDGCVLNWGGGDYKDLMLGLDEAISNNDWIDSDRLGVIGGSYGGFMTNWIVTQTDRFKAAIAVASVSNLISFYGTSLYQLLIEVEFNGMPWDNYDLLWHYSPLRHIKNVTTPTMLIHGENDHDVPITQAEEMYIALRKLGVDTEFIRYPGEGHGFRQTAHQVDYMQRQVEWFDRYLKGENSAMSHEP